MKKTKKHKKPQPRHKKTIKSKKPALETSPSRDIDNSPVSENDNSPNLFQEHIRESGQANPIPRP